MPALGFGLGICFSGAAPSPIPTLSAISPSIGAVAGGVTVTLTGTNFVAGVTTFAIGGTACTSVNVTSATTATAVTPAKSLGTYDVTATTSGKTGTLAAGYDSWDPQTAGYHVYYASAGAAAAQWTDQNGSPNNATQGNASYQPVVSAGPPANIAFNARAYEQDAIASAGEICVFLLFKLYSLPGAGNFQSAITLKQSATKTFFELIFSALGGAYQPYTFVALAGSGASVGIADALDTNPHRLVMTYNNGNRTAVGSYTAKLDGVAKTVAASSTLNRTTTDIGAIGGRIPSTHIVPASVAPWYAYAHGYITPVPDAAGLSLLDRYLATIPMS